MKYTMFRLLLVAAACCGLSLSSSNASAGWGLLHGGSGGGGSAGYGSYGSVGSGSAGGGSSGGYAVASYGSSGGGYGSYGSTGGGSTGGGSTGGGGSSGVVAGGSSGGPGPLRRLAAHVHDHFAAKAARRAAYGSSGGSVGGGSSGGSGGYVSSYGSSGGYSPSYGSTGASYGSTGSHSSSYGSAGSVSYGSAGSYSSSYGSTGSSYSSGYMGVSTLSPSTTSMLASHSSSNASDEAAIHLNVDVPEKAKVFVNDAPTTSTGMSRQFVSRGLEAGKKYKFDVRVELTDASGTLVSDTKSVTLTAGDRETLSFASMSKTPIQTVVTLNVPADAKVTLAGNPTNATGTTRTFRTGQLKAGDRWDDYVVEVEHAGKVKRETLRLLAGDDIALTFHFEEDDKKLVASR